MSRLAANTERVTCVVEGTRSKVKVYSLLGSEYVSGLFGYTLTVVSEDPELDFDAIVGRFVVIKFLAPDDTLARYVHGLVTHIDQSGQGNRLTTYTLRLAPHVWLLTQRTNCRIFQSMTVPDIIKDVLKTVGVPADRFKFSLKSSYTPRDYCVQYRETDFVFISRLMEEEGIFYFFQHTKLGKEVAHMMVLTDHSTVHETLSGNATVVYHPPTTGIKTEDSIFPFVFRQGVRSGAVVLKDFDFRKPALKIKSSQKHTVDDNLETFEYPGRLNANSDGNRLAKIHLEALQVARKTGDGFSDCLRFIAGTYFTLDAHPRESLNQEYLLTQVDTTVQQPQVLEEGAGLAPAVYQNRFFCIPATVQFRATIGTTKPIVNGVQTAIVVGPAGEEVYPDEFGRVKVQFHWDRKGKSDEKSSCWIRVSQIWAGAGWGAMFIPRIGHEVIVDFVDGDPDRPIITGRVYHGTNRPPYPLPEDRTRSTIKTNSSKGGGGSNELRFEDKKGKEEVYLHSQKDWTIKIENDKNQDVGHDETLHVGNDRTKNVDHNQTETIGDNKTISVGKNHDESIGENATISVGKNVDITIGKNQSIHVAERQTEDVGKDYDLSVGGNQRIAITKDLSINVGKKTIITAGDEIVLSCGSASIVMKKNGDITISGKNINVTGSGNIVMKGSKITQN